PLAVPTTDTLAPESGCPVSLVTVPVIWPVACASRDPGAHRRAAVASASNPCIAYWRRFIQYLQRRMGTGSAATRPVWRGRHGWELRTQDGARRNDVGRYRTTRMEHGRTPAAAVKMEGRRGSVRRPSRGHRGGSRCDGPFGRRRHTPPRSGTGGCET